MILIDFKTMERLKTWNDWEKERLRLRRRSFVKGVFETAIKDLTAQDCSFYYLEIEYNELWGFKGTEVPSKELGKTLLRKAWENPGIDEGEGFSNALELITEAFIDPLTEFQVLYFDPILLKYYVFFAVRNLFLVNGSIFSKFVNPRVYLTYCDIEVSVSNGQEACNKFMYFLSNVVDEKGYLYFTQISCVYEWRLPLYDTFDLCTESLTIDDIESDNPFDEIKEHSATAKKYKNSLVWRRLRCLPSMPVYTKDENLIIRLWQVYFYVKGWEARGKRIYTYQGEYVGTVKKVLFGNFVKIHSELRAVGFSCLERQLLMVNWSAVYPLYERAAEKRITEDSKALNILESLKLCYPSGSRSEQIFKIILDEEGQV